MNAADPLLGTLIDGRYRVERVIGAGGFGTVYAAFHVGLGSPVALKVLKLPQLVGSEQLTKLCGAFFDEARTLKRLRHPNIVAALDVGLLPAEEGGIQLPYLVMEWCGGPTLEAHLEARGSPMPLIDAWKMFEPLLDAMAHAHAHGVAHRDIKPSNVLVESEIGVDAIRPRLVDFGIAKIVAPDDKAGSGDTSTVSGGSPFTPRYAAPEQLAGGRTGVWTDVHALALLFVELVIGRPPIGDDQKAIAALFAPTRPTPKAFGVDVGPFESIIERALALRPSDRYADAAELGDAMREVAPPEWASTAERSGPTPTPSAESRKEASDIDRDVSPPSSMTLRTSSRALRPKHIPPNKTEQRVVGDRFRIEARAGAGGSSVVYRAIDTRDGMAVALKIPHDPSAFDLIRFEREVEILSGGNDGRIVSYIAHGADAETGPWLAMEWLDGETLSSRLSDRGVSVADAVHLAIDLAETLGSLHRRGIVHRDVKPSNVFLVGGNPRKPKLLDFGIARCATHPSITKAGALVGTVGYMSPEQVRGEEALDHRSDVFSLGCLLFQCVTGKLPFEGDHPTEWLMKLALEDAPRADSIASDLPAGLSDLLSRSLQKPASARQANMLEVATELRGLEAKDAPVSRRSVRAPAITSTERRFASLLLFRKLTHQANGTGIAEEVARHGGTLHESPDGLVLVTFDRAAEPTDLASSAAKLGLALSDGWPSLRVVVLSTWLTKDRIGFKAAIDTATTLFTSAEPGAVVVDEATKSLLMGSIASSPLLPATGLSATTGVRAHVLVAKRLVVKQSTTPFVGRERELGTIVDAFEHAFAEGTAEVVLALGHAGIGKSRLAHEARARIVAEWPKVTALFAAAETGDRTGSLGLIRSLLRAYFSIPEGPSDPERVRSRLTSALESIIDPREIDLEVGFLCELLFSSTWISPSSAVLAARAEPRLMKDQLTRAVDLWLRGLLRRGPLLIQIESLHAADEVSLTLLDHFLGTVSNAPLLLIGTGRLEVTDRFPTLFADRSVTTIKLRELVPRAAEQLTRALVPSAPDDLRRRVVELGGGNPFLLEELARAAREGNDRELPDSVLALSQGRLDRLSERERRFLRAASVFGERFFIAGVSALLGASDDTETLTSLARRDVVRCVSTAAPQAYAFQSPVLRQVAYASIPENEIARAHLRAADCLEAAGETRALELAFHFEHGAAPRKAAAWYLRAARQSLEAMDLPSAAHWGDKALEADPRPALAGAALCLRAQVEEARWAWPETKRFALDAMELLPEGGVLWFMAAHALAPSLTRTGEIDAFFRLAERLKRTTPLPEATNMAVLAMAAAANTLALGGSLDQANEMLQHVDELVSDLPEDASGVAYAVMARGGVAMKSGDLGAYRQLRAAAAERFERLNDWRKAVEVRGTTGFADCLLGRYEEALSALSNAVVRALDYRLTTVHYLRHNVGLVLFQLGRYAEARETLESTLEPLHSIDRRLERGSMQYLARALVALGERDLAERHARTALEGAERPNAMMSSRGDLAHVLLAQGRWAEAAVLAEEAAKPLTPDGPFDESEMFVRVALIRARAATKNLVGARLAAQEAHERLQILSNRISDAAFRKSFIDCVAEHVALRHVTESLS